MADRAIVLLHAFPLDARMWAPQREGLSSPWRVFAPDLPGFGAEPPGPADLAAWADGVVARLDREGVGAAVFVGLSMGGYVAFRVLDRHPDRVAGLVLADTRAVPDSDAQRARRTEQAARARADGTAWLGDAMVPNLLGDTTRRLRPGTVDTVRSIVASARGEGVARALEALRDRPDSTDLLPGIAVPTLVLCGAEDGISPPLEMSAMAAAIPGSLFVPVPGAGHLSNLENPETFNRSLQEFLARF